MASLALTRPIYSQEGKISLLQIHISFISHKQLNHPSSLLFKEKLSFDIIFPNSWIRCGFFSTAWDTALHRKWELLLEHKALFQPLWAPTSAGSFEATSCIKEPYFPSPESKSEALAQSLTFNLNSGSPRWRQSLYVVSFAGENCALINTWRRAKKRKGNTNSYIIQLQPSAEFQLFVTSSSSCTGSWKGELGAYQRHADFNVTNVLNTFLMEGV